MWMKPIRILLETEFTFGADAETQTDTSNKEAEKKEEVQPSDSEE